MIDSNPDAIFDCLYIGNRLQKKIQDFSMYEIQFFSYFSCLLALYDGNDVSSWNYAFVRTELGSPYSSDIHRAITILTSGAFLKEENNSREYFTVTGKGIEYLDFIERSITSISWRKKYLDTACTSVSLLPFNSIKEAINLEPVLNSARYGIKKNLLLDTNPATRALYAQFKSLKAALEDKYSDLIVPATVWIEALNTNNKTVVQQ